MKFGLDDTIAFYPSILVSETGCLFVVVVVFFCLLVWKCMGLQIFVLLVKRVRVGDLGSIPVHPNKPRLKLKLVYQHYASIILEILTKLLAVWLYCVPRQLPVRTTTFILIRYMHEFLLMQ